MPSTTGQFFNALRANARFVAPHWLSSPTLSSPVIGSPLTLSGGSVTGVPTPVVSYQLTVGGVSQAWPYTVQVSDSGAAIVLTPIATAMGFSVAATTIHANVPVAGAVPGPVTGLNFISITQTGFTIAFGAPTTGGAASSYSIAYRQTGTSGAWVTTNTTNTFLVVSGLAVATSYDVQVTAINNIGNSSVVSGSQATLSAEAVFFPTSTLGQNMALDTTYSTMRIYNDRAQVASFYAYPYSGASYPAASKDANGFPTSAFCTKLAEGAFALDPSSQGVWWLQYHAPVQRVVSNTFGTGVISNHVFSGGVGSFQIAYSSTSALGINFDGAITGLSIYDPTNSAAAIAGNSGTIPFWNAQFLRTVYPYEYIRFMDNAGVNFDYAATASAATTTWNTAVAWSDRMTPSNFRLRNSTGTLTFAGFLPLEQQIDLLSQTNRSGWFNIPEMATDDCITQFATLVATTLPAGLWAGFELGNEHWNTSGGFYCYRKAGAAALTEMVAGQPGNAVPLANVTSFASDGTNATITFASGAVAVPTVGSTPVIHGLVAGYTGFTPSGPISATTSSGSPTIVTITYPCTQASTGGAVAATTVLGTSGSWVMMPYSEFFVSQRNFNVVSFSADGVTPGFPGATSTATVVFNTPHGVTGSNNIPVVKTILSGYSGFAPVANAKVTVVDAYTISYPCTQPSTGGVLAANVVLDYKGFVALNGASNLLSTGFVYTIYDASHYWHCRRATQMAALVKAAFVAAGRSTADCKPILALLAGTNPGDLTSVSSFILAAQGTALGANFTAVAVGGYLTIGQGGLINQGFGLTGTNLTTDGTTPITTSSQILTLMRQSVNLGYAALNYGGFAAWARDQGVEPWGYEVGIDTYGNGVGVTGSRSTAADGANADPLMEGIVRDWLYSLRTLGFTKVGWYQCGAGTYTGFGCFNLGQSANEIDYTTTSASRSPKFNALLDSESPWPTKVSRHAFPCTLNAWDAVGNEAQVTTGAVNGWPYINGSGSFQSTFGYVTAANNGTTYDIWSEAGQTATLTINGQATATSTITARVLGTSSSGSFTTVAAGTPSTGATLGTISLTLQPGPNYVFISASNPSQVFPHSLQFS